MSKALCGGRHWSDLVYRQRTLSSIATCELILNLGIPILQSYAVAILRNVGGIVDVSRHAPDGLLARAKRDAKHMGLSELTVDPVPIHECARWSFFLASI